MAQLEPRTTPGNEDERFESRPQYPHIVYDRQNQGDVFHWYGRMGKAKCDAVAAALNSLNHGTE